MTTYTADIEADGLWPTKIHCIAIRDHATGKDFFFTDMGDFEDWWYPQDHLSITWVFHNGLNYDVPHINRLTSVVIPETRVIDTMVVSKLRNYRKYRTHSLDEIGTSLGHPKTKYEGGWDEYTEEMGQYCRDDVSVTHDIFKDQHAFIFKEDNRLALRTEHNVAQVCYKIGLNGFPFDRGLAERMLEEVKKELFVLEESFRSVIPPKRTEDRRLKYRTKKDGTLFASVVKTMASEEDTELSPDGTELIVYKKVEFNPASNKQCIDLLWEYGWVPLDKTKGYLKYERELRKKYYQEVDQKRLASFKRYGWKLNEVNLSTIPDSAPQVIKGLTQWLTLDGRRSSLEEWIGCWDHRDERIHPKLWHIGVDTPHVPLQS